MAITIDSTELQPLIAQTIETVLESINNRICYTEREAAAAIGTSPSTLRRARLQRRVQAYKVGRAWRYRPRDLEDYVTSQPSF